MTTAVLRMKKTAKVKLSALALPEANWKIVLLFLACVMFFAVLFYAWQVNSLTRGSYVVENYQKKIKNISSENKDLQVSFAESSFMGKAIGKAQEMNFEKTTSIKYIKILENTPTAYQK